MNTRNAQYTGYDDGKKALRDGVPFANRQAFIDHGVWMSSQMTRYIKTADLYAQGWAEAWREPEPKKAPAQHNPDTRFCECDACNI